MKKFIIVIIGFLVVLALISFNHYTRVYFDNNDEIMKKLNLLKQKDLELNNEVLQISIYLYKNFDTIVKLEKEIDQLLKQLQNNQNFKEKKVAYEDFVIYKKAILTKIDEIYELETLIAPLKNSSMYIAELLNKLPTSTIKKSDRRKILYIASQIFLVRNSFDLTFMKDIHSKIVEMHKYHDDKLYNVFFRNIELFDNLFPIYIKQMNEIFHLETQQKLEKCMNQFLIESNRKLRIITIVSVLLILFVIVSIILILYLFFKIEKENLLLEEIVITDNLTGLFNRRKLEQDIPKSNNPILFIVNIDRFKYYNDFYGVEAGDFILKQTGYYLQKIFPSMYSAKFYRLGADDFGILVEHIDGMQSKVIAQKIIDYFKKTTIIYKELEFHIFVTIGISHIKPLIETADIALKSIKKNKKTNIGIYNPALGEKQKIEDNIIKTTILKTAIDNHQIIPYFQPIYSNKTGKIAKYEVLARVIDEEKVMSIYPFLEIAKENKVYKYITQMIYAKAFEEFKDKQIEFSINISIEDINDEDTMKFIKTSIKHFPEIFKYITFEILEDDAINNYDLLKEFIIFVKDKGAKIAIDDFGSGYSNFAHILNLDIDFLKIDGSLIKNLDEDERMELIVETIVEFAHKTGIEVIGEFVHSKEVLEKVKNLNIDYSQGYYLGAPKGKLV